MKLLLVDDEPFALGLLEERVQAVSPTAEYHSFTSAEKAMKFAAQNTIDVALLDINMRVLDGVTMARQLQELNPRVNVIFCTGYGEYMRDALALYCSGYLMKPIDEGELREALDHLRYPVAELRVSIHCFGNFEVYCDGRPVHFQYNRTKELLAYLVDRNGVDCTTQELMTVLFETETSWEYFKQLRRDLIGTLSKLGAEEILRVSRGRLGIEREKVDCDYFRFMDRGEGELPADYMSQYSFW